MKKRILTTISVVLTAVCALAAGDNYTQLWKEYEQAQKKDLPKTETAVLDKIIARAQQDHSYGHLLKAQVNRIFIEASVAPDSLPRALQKLTLTAEKAEATDSALAAVYYYAAGSGYATHYTSYTTEDGDYHAKSQECYAKALENPAVLARTKTQGYVPFVNKRYDSELFNHDLLSVIGYAVNDYATLARYYSSTGNRRAAVITTLEDLHKRYNAGEFSFNRTLSKSTYVVALDSLISLYSDLPECAEVALAKLSFMDRSFDATIDQKVAYAKHIIATWPTWRNTNTARNMLGGYTQPTFTVSNKSKTFLPEKKTVLAVTACNINSLMLTATRLNKSGDIDLSPQYSGDWKKIRTMMQGNGQSVIRTFRQHNDYETMNDSITLPALKPGIYAIEIKADNSAVTTERSLLSISDVKVVLQPLPGRSYRLAALSATTGQPLPGATFQITLTNDKKVTLTTDSHGEAVLQKQSADISSIRAYTATDNYMQSSGAWSNYTYLTPHNTTHDISIFTDRAIYRPGQTVHVTAVAYNTVDNKQTKVDAGTKVTATLYNSNNKQLKQVDLTTDEYGTASTDFVLPAGELTGRYSVRFSGKCTKRKYFSVEEYKRPTFEVTIPDVDTEYHSGDTLTVEGKAMTYAGVPVQGATVAYTVESRLTPWCLYRGVRLGTEEQTLLTDTVRTDDKGTFRMLLPLTMPDDFDEEDAGNNGVRYYHMPRYYTFTTTAKVTDAAGETHTSEMTLRLGSHPTSLSCDLPEKIRRDSIPTLMFTRKNMSFKDISGTVNYYIDNPTDIRSAEANTAIAAQEWSGSNLTSGKHTLTAVCEGDTISTEFIVFGIDDRRPAIETHDWGYVSASTFRADGSPVYVQVGSSDADTHILYTIVSGDRLLESGTCDVSDSIVTTPYTYKEDYGNGIVLNYAWVKSGTLYTHQFRIEKPLPDKKFVTSWTTFRDKLTPGQKEEWTLRICRKDSVSGNLLPAVAQTLAVMYDKSLDQIREHTWSFSCPIYNYLPYTSWRSTASRYFGASGSASVKRYDTKPFSFSTFSIDSGSWYNAIPHDEIIYVAEAAPMRRMATLRRDSEVVAMASMKQYDSTAESNELSETVTIRGYASNENSSDEEESAEQAAANSVSVRENLQETAFCLPTLLSDNDGNVNIRFTLPESLTTWAFKAFTHDKDMNYALTEATATASKNIMVMPNVPRFVRQGDESTITARVVNTTDKPLSAVVRMQILDPTTENIVYTQTLKTKIDANGTTAATFSYRPQTDATLLVCRITAEGGGHSDGEQHYLPVLSDKELAMNTIPFTISKGKTDFNVGDLFPQGASDKKLTIEYTANPSWLMIQALPHVSAINNKDAVSISTAYYANALGRHIMNLSPAIKKTVAIWKQEAANSSALESELSKNADLKSILLEETPWLMDADKETEQKQTLTNFFDETLMDNRNTTLLANLKKLQNSDGSWSWYPGMKGSPYVTAQVAETLVRLAAMTGSSRETSAITSSALRYLGKEVVNDYEEILKEKKKGHEPWVDTHMALQYLYVIALAGRTATGKEKDAKDFFFNHLRKDRTAGDLYSKALMAVVLSKEGKTTEAAEYVESLRQYTVSKPLMGRYFDTPRATYSWCDYRIPTHVAALEALQAVAPSDAATINEMRLWLLQEKRTQMWSTPINTVNAIYAFFNIDNKKEVLATTADINLSVDGHRLATPKATAAIGYVKTTADAASAHTLSVSKTDDNTSWGAVYAQFTQKATDIQQSASGLTIRREVLLNGKSLTGDKTAAFHVGDRVTVRITVSAERDYDFVQIQDKRAACMEPTDQLSGYHGGCYRATKDNATNYFFDKMRKGVHTVESTYHIDRAGTYHTGTCTVQCAYAPAFTGRDKALTITAK